MGERWRNCIGFTLTFRDVRDSEGGERPRLMPHNVFRVSGGMPRWRMKGLKMTGSANRTGLYSAVITALLLAGCTVTWDNPRPAQEVAHEQSRPSGSAYLGWRVFQDKCAACHGAAATGTANAPDLLVRVRDMGERRFVGLVLQRYDLNQPALAVGSGRAADAAQIEIIMQRKDAPLAMPAWQGEPRVQAHIMDLYAYLSARAQGSLGTQRPQP